MDIYVALDTDQRILNVEPLELFLSLAYLLTPSSLQPHLTSYTWSRLSMKCAAKLQSAMANVVLVMGLVRVVISVCATRLKLVCFVCETSSNQEGAKEHAGKAQHAQSRMPRNAGV